MSRQVDKKLPELKKVEPMNVQWNKSIARTLNGLPKKNPGETGDGRLRGLVSWYVIIMILTQYSTGIELVIL